jgi:hypothetical protein
MHFLSVKWFRHREDEVTIFVVKIIRGFYFPKGF